MRERLSLARFTAASVPAYRHLISLYLGCVLLCSASMLVLTGSHWLTAAAAVFAAVVLRKTIALPAPEAVRTMLDTSILSLEMSQAVLTALQQGADGSCRINLSGISRGSLITDDGAFDIPQTADQVWVRLGTNACRDADLMQVLSTWHAQRASLQVTLMFRNAGAAAELGSAVLAGPDDVEVRLNTSTASA